MFEDDYMHYSGEKPMNEPPFGLGVFLGIILGATLSFGFTYALTIGSMQQKAVEEGVACYYLNENHQREFKWSKCDE